jgi:hypothetical protein
MSAVTRLFSSAVTRFLSQAVIRFLLHSFVIITIVRRRRLRSPRFAAVSFGSSRGGNSLPY